MYGENKEKTEKRRVRGGAPCVRPPVVNVPRSEWAPGAQSGQKGARARPKTTSGGTAAALRLSGGRGPAVTTARKKRESRSPLFASLQRSSVAPLGALIYKAGPLSKYPYGVERTLSELRYGVELLQHCAKDPAVFSLIRAYGINGNALRAAKLEQRGFLLARPAVNIQTSRPVIVGGKTSSNGAAHLLRPQLMPWESQPSMSSGTLSSSGTGSARPLHMVELKNNHRSPTGSTPPFRSQASMRITAQGAANNSATRRHTQRIRLRTAVGTATANRRQDKVRGIFTDLFGSTRTNIAKHLRQATESVRRDTEVPLSRVTDLADSLDAQARKLPDLRAELAESAAAARVLELRVFTEDAYEPLRAAASLASRAAADLEKRMPPMLQKVAETATGLRTAIGDLRGALENATTTVAPNDAYYVALSEEDDFWKR
ncbi:hypothetical protein HPB49_019398 [Dermacentor silvarum]|uniref:Uncharacterized protein n=1 Tax=Dermacentor silvarum TaxID=543639 RepID=A0ACB8CZF1_DERSI|nr:hypothetical protein HPB49_019398 [Dermacentor silvarum]